MKVKGFLLFLDALDKTEDLSDRQMREVLRILKKYAQTSELMKSEDISVNLAVGIFIDGVDYGLAQYKKKCEIRAKNWSKGKRGKLEAFAENLAADVGVKMDAALSELEDDVGIDKKRLSEAMSYKAYNTVISSRPHAADGSDEEYEVTDRGVSIPGRISSEDYDESVTRRGVSYNKVVARIACCDGRVYTVKMADVVNIAAKFRTSQSHVEIVAEEFEEYSKKSFKKAKYDNVLTKLEEWVRKSVNGVIGNPRAFEFSKNNEELLWEIKENPDSDEAKAYELYIKNNNIPNYEAALEIVRGGDAVDVISNQEQLQEDEFFIRMFGKTKKELLV